MKMEMGPVGGRDGLHRQGLRLPAGREAQVPRGRVRPGGPGALRFEAQPRLAQDTDEHLQL